MQKTIDVGSCTATFGGTALGKSKGGVKVSFSSETTEIETDQDLAIVDEIITKLGIEVEYPMTEIDFETLQLCLPGSVLVTDATTPTKQQIVVNGNAGGSLLDYADELVITPSSGKAIGKLTLFNAAPVPNLELSYEKSGQRVYSIKFKGYVDTTTGKLFAFGDTTAVSS